MKRNAGAPAHLSNALEAVGKPMSVEDDGVTAGSELNRGRRECAADDVVLVRRFGQPRVDPAVDNELQEHVASDVHAVLEGGGDETRHRRLADAGRATDGEDGRAHERDGMTP